MGMGDSMLGVQRREQQLWDGCGGEVGIREASKGDGTWPEPQRLGRTSGEWKNIPDRKKALSLKSLK